MDNKTIYYCGYGGKTLLGKPWRETWKVSEDQ